MKRLLKEFANATLIGVVLYIVFLAIFLFSGGEIRLTDGFWMDFLEHMIFSWTIYLANALLITFMIQRYGHRIFRLNVLPFCILGNVVVSLMGIFLARALISAMLRGTGFDGVFQLESAGYYVNTLIVSVIISGIFYAVFYYKHRQESRVKQQKIIAGTASAQFDALKNQLDPHFLFNSLNVLTSLIEEDPDKAQRFTTGLSKVYRYVLEQKNKELVGVDEEYAFARAYVRLLKMRFEEGIVFDIPEQSTYPEARIVPLSLQLLLENAVKHNRVSAEAPLHIKVTEQDGYIMVTNNLQQKEVITKSSGVGLQNIRNRYALLTDRLLVIDRTADTFRVGIPMLTRQTSAPPTQQEYIEDKRYQKAREKVEAIKGFFGNLVAYCLVIPFLVWLNWRTTAFPWAIFPAVGWGFGLVMHGMEAYGYNPLWGRRWEERKIRELMEKDDF